MPSELSRGSCQGSGYPARRNAFEVREEFCTSSRGHFLCLWKGSSPPQPFVLRTEVFLETQTKIAGFSRRLVVCCFFGFGGFFYFFLGDCFSTWRLCCGVDVTSWSDASHPHEPLEQVGATFVPGGHRREPGCPGLGAGVTKEPCGCPPDAGVRARGAFILHPPAGSRVSVSSHWAKMRCEGSVRINRADQSGNK